MVMEVGQPQLNNHINAAAQLFKMDNFQPVLLHEVFQCK
jgi:hypothetical protein